MAGKQGKKVEESSKIHNDRPKAKSRKKSRSQRQKGNGKAKKPEVQKPEGAAKETSSSVPLELESISERIKKLGINETVHSPDLVLLKKTPKDGETNFQKETWSQKPKMEVQKKADTKGKIHFISKMNCKYFLQIFFKQSRSGLVCQG